ELVRFDVFVEDELSGVRTFDPQIFRRVAARKVIANFWPDVGDPVHAAVLSGAYMDRPRTAGNGEKSRMLPQGSAAAAQLRLPGEAKCGIFIEKCGCIARARAFDREQRELRRNAAVGLEPAGLGAGRQHAMARHDDGEGVASE